MIEGGKALAEKELLENVSGDLETFSDMFKEYTEELDKKEEKEKYIAGTLINLKSCIEAEERKSAEAAEIIKKCKEIEKKIKHEELSEQYHGIKRSLLYSASLWIFERSGKIVSYSFSLSSDSSSDLLMP